MIDAEGEPAFITGGNPLNLIASMTPKERDRLAQEWAVLEQAEGYEPMPDAPVPAPVHPDRVQTLEMQVTLLASGNARLKRALRGVITHAFPLSDKGHAPWYRDALAALGTSDDGA